MQKKKKKKKTNKQTNKQTRRLTSKMSGLLSGIVSHNFMPVVVRPTASTDSTTEDTLPVVATSKYCHHFCSPGRFVRT